MLPCPGYYKQCCDEHWGLITTGESIPLLSLEGVPGLPGAPQDEAGLTRKFAPLFSPACWEPGFQAWAQSTCPELPAQGLVPLRWGCPMFIAALFIIARTWKQPRCPSADEWIRKLWHLVLSEEGNPAGLSSCSGGLRPLVELCVRRRRQGESGARCQGGGGTGARLGLN